MNNHECIHCGEAILDHEGEPHHKRIALLLKWGKPLTCLPCASKQEAEEKAAQYQLAPAHDVAREDAPYFEAVLSPGKHYGYNHGNAARLGRQTATYQGGRS